ncbi:MAG: hypothetical protein ACQER1_12975 [Armatimonadota bacterium]
MEPEKINDAADLVQRLEETTGLQLTASAPFNRIAEILVDQGCQSVEVEKSYYCRDFMSQYAFLYGRVLEEIPRWPTRLHFFRENQSPDHYLGYSVVGPLTSPEGSATVGRTVIGYEQPGHYVTCREEYTAHIQGVRHGLVGTPFVQQDGRVMNCAHTSVWVMNRLISKAEPTVKDHYPHEIAEMARQHITRGPLLPTTGLWADQILNCVHGVGTEPLYYYYGDDAQRSPADGIIYRYVESGLPVIVGLPGHAVCVVGHTFDPNRPQEDDSIGDYKTPTSWVSHFIVQDEAAGPFALLPSRESEPNRLVAGPVLNASISENIRMIIIPLPRNVVLSGEAAEIRAHHILHFDPRVQKAMRQACETEVCQTYGLKSAYERDHPDQRMVLRAYLTDSNEFKSRMSKLAEDGTSSEALDVLADRYRCLFMSRYVWVVELSTEQLFACNEEKERRMIGEIVLDATASAHSHPEFAVHVPGNLFWNDPRKPLEVRHEDLPNDRPYPHKIHRPLMQAANS